MNRFKHNIEQTFQQDDIRNTGQSSPDMPTADCGMGTYENPENPPSCHDDSN
jgi:hypothetical protein